MYLVYIIIDDGRIKRFNGMLKILACHWAINDKASPYFTSLPFQTYLPVLPNKPMYTK